MGTVTTFTFTSDSETVTRTKLNNLVADLLTEFNGNIDNNNIKASAGIVYSKLSLGSSITTSDLAYTASESSSTTFTNGDLTAGVYTFNHALAQKAVVINVYNGSDQQITPDEVTLTDTNNASIDLSSFGTITGTWNIIANT